MTLEVKAKSVERVTEESFPRTHRDTSGGGAGTASVRMARTFLNLALEMDAISNINTYSGISTDEGELQETKRAVKPLTKEMTKRIGSHGKAGIILESISGFGGGGAARDQIYCANKCPIWIPQVNRILDKEFEIASLNSGIASCSLKNNSIAGGSYPVGLYSDARERVMGQQPRTKIGFTPIPGISDPLARQNFADWLPLQAADNFSTFDALLIVDNNMQDIGQINRSVITSFFTTVLATRESQPAFSDIWRTLTNRGRHKLIGINSVSEPVRQYRHRFRFWKKFYSSENGLEQIQRLVKSVISEPASRLIQASTPEYSYKVVTVSTPYDKRTFDEAIRQLNILDHRVLPIYAKSYSSLTDVSYLYQIERSSSIHNALAENSEETNCNLDLLEKNAMEPSSRVKGILASLSNATGLSMDVLLGRE